MPEPAAKRDTLGTIDVIVRMISVVLIPILIVVVGNSYNNQQKKLEEIRSVNENTANRLTAMLKNFSSENPRERKLAVVIATYLAENNQLPGELVRVLAEIAETDTNREVSNAAFLSLAAVANAGKEQAPEANAILNELPGRIYIQIPDKSRMNVARQIETMLAANGYRVPEIEVVSRVVGDSQIRYFHTGDKAEAEKIAGFLHEKGYITNPVFIQGFENRVRPRQFEIWLSGK